MTDEGLRFVAMALAIGLGAIGPGAGIGVAIPRPKVCFVPTCSWALHWLKFRSFFPWCSVCSSASVLSSFGVLE